MEMKITANQNIRNVFCKFIDFFSDCFIIKASKNFEYMNNKNDDREVEEMLKIVGLTNGKVDQKIVDFRGCL